MTVLYRVHRPSTWNEVVGQDHVVSALKDAILQDRIAHAYLFAGSRGTGKTSIARILAKALKTANEDVYEIDAASNTGVDNIRDLREHVNVLPFSSKYKVYIIDEAHMLSKAAWNALLKTLEEPPAHVLFIFATTDADKVLDTIISRCQVFRFNKPNREILRKEAIRIGKKEGYELETGAADLIALLGDGSFRDTLGTLQRVIIASSGKKITREHVEVITGAPKSTLVNSFIESILSKNSGMALGIISEAEQGGVSMNIFLSLILEKMRLILLKQHGGNNPVLEACLKSRVSEDDFVFIVAQADKKQATPAILIALLDAASRTPRAEIDQLPLELAVIGICG